MRVLFWSKFMPTCDNISSWQWKDPVRSNFRRRQVKFSRQMDVGGNKPAPLKLSQLFIKNSNSICGESLEYSAWQLPSLHSRHLTPIYESEHEAKHLTEKFGVNASSLRSTAGAISSSALATSYNSHRLLCEKKLGLNGSVKERMKQGKSLIIS